MSGRRDLRLAVMAAGGALLALTSCSFHSDYNGTSYQCGAGDSCPAGYLCVSGVCELPGQQADAGGSDASVQRPPDASSMSDAGMQATCGGLALLQDDFANGIKGPLWNQWNDTGASASENGGLFHVNVDAGTAAAWAGRTSRAVYDLTGSSITVTVPQVGAQHTVLEIRDADGNRLQIDYHSGMLYAKSLKADGTTIDSQSATYDAVAQARWRIREASGTIYWETSPDGQTYNELMKTAPPFPITSVRAILAAGGQLAQASEAQFDDVNLPADPDLPGYCPFSSIHDDFSGGVIGPPWDDQWADTGATVSEDAGLLTMTFPGTGDVWAGVETWHLYDLNDDALVLDLPPLPSQYATFETYAQVITLNGASKLLIEQYDSQLIITVTVAGADVQSNSLTYDSTSQRFWRFRAAGRIAYIDTSPDGATWTTRLTTASGLFDMSALRLELGAGHWAPGPGQAVTTHIAAVNP